MRHYLVGAAMLALVAGSAPFSAVSAAPKNDPVVKIGVDLPVSGADATDGIPTRNGVQLAVEEYAKKMPAGFTLQMDPLDDAVQGVHDPAAGAQNVKTFIADGAVLAMVGPFNSNVARAEIPLTNDASLVQISPSNTNDTLTGPASAPLRTAHPDMNSYFRDCTRDSKQGAALAQFAKKLGFKKAYIIDDNETYGKGLADVFEASFKDGGMVLGHEHITKGQQDFKALLTKVKSTNPDVVFYGGTTSTGGGLVRKQMGDVGMNKIPYMGGDGISDAEFLKIAGTMADGSYYTVAAPNAMALPSAQSFIKAYKARFSGDIGPYSANAYAAAQIEIEAIIKAIKSNGGKMPTRAEILKNVGDTKDASTPIGVVGFDKAGDTTAPILSLYAIKNGKQDFVQQITLKT